MAKKYGSNKYKINIKKNKCPACGQEFRTAVLFFKFNEISLLASLKQYCII